MTEGARAPLAVEADRRDLLEDQREIVDVDVRPQPARSLRPLEELAIQVSGPR